jgi:hypothetical protein
MMIKAFTKLGSHGGIAQSRLDECLQLGRASRQFALADHPSIVGSYVRMVYQFSGQLNGVMPATAGMPMATSAVLLLRYR